jgi:hypothetical protein
MVSLKSGKSLSDSVLSDGAIGRAGTLKALDNPLLSVHHELHHS